MINTTRLKNRILQSLYRPTSGKLTQLLSEDSKDFLTKLEEKLEEKAAAFWE